MTDSDKTAADPQAAADDAARKAAAVQAATQEAAAQEKAAEELAAADQAAAKQASTEGTAARTVGANTRITETLYAAAPDYIIETLDATVGKYSPAPAFGLAEIEYTLDARVPKHAAAPAYSGPTLEATVPKNAAAPGLREFKEKPYDPDQARDDTRRGIAYWLLALLTLVVACSFVIVIVFSDGKVTFDNLKSLLELVMGPIVALVSAATGFYFGSQQANNSKKS